MTGAAEERAAYFQTLSRHVIDQAAELSSAAIVASAGEAQENPCGLDLEASDLALIETVAAGQGGGLSMWQQAQARELAFWRWVAFHGYAGKHPLMFPLFQEHFMVSTFYRSGWAMAEFHDAAIVEIGCGPLGMIEYLPAARRVAFDPLNQRYSRLFAKFRHDDIEYLSERNELLTQAPFDLAICHNTLDHTDQPAVWFNDLFARLRDGGRFIFQVNLSREDLPQSAEHRAMHPSALTIDQVMGWLQMKSSSFDYFCESKANSDNEFYFLSWGTKTADEPVIYHPVTIPIRVQTPATMDSNASPPPREAVPLEAAPLKIAEPATQVDVGPRPLTTRFVPPWLGGITIKGGTEPFVNLPTIAELAGVAALQKQALREFGLNEPLSGYRSRDTGPLPAVADREHYFGPNHTGYWLSGLSDTLSVADHAKRLGLGPQVQYFELGCASGRVVRHVAFQTDAQIWCCDLNKRHTEWVRQFLPERIKVFHNSAIPNLPLPDNSVDVASAFSVFTHIDDFETAWLLELHRILRPGGLAYLTISSEYTWEQYKQNWIKDQLLPLSENITEYSISEKFFEGSLPREKTVIWWPAGQDVYNATVFHETSYIRKEWGRLFTVIDIIRNGHAYQDVVLLTK